MEYKNEAYNAFQNLTSSMYDDYLRTLLRLEIAAKPAAEGAPAGAGRPAPAALAELPAPDRVFLGGTSGSLEEILRLALEKNPAVRFVLTAVTLETLSEAVRCMEKLGLEAELVQLSATRTRRAGGYHLMDAQNPVWIISGEARHE